MINANVVVVMFAFGFVSLPETENAISYKLSIFHRVITELLAIFNNPQQMWYRECFVLFLGRVISRLIKVNREMIKLKINFEPKCNAEWAHEHAIKV